MEPLFHPSQDAFSYWHPGSGTRPRLFLAPMEGLGDKAFRAAASAAFPGSFDEASTEFLRLTLPDSLCPDSRRARRCYRGMLSSFAYDPRELHHDGQHPHPAPPIALQLMLAGDQADVARAFVQWMFEELEPELRPHRIDLNMGCPSKCTTSWGLKLKGSLTTRRGAGSSLLRDPADVAALTRGLREGIGNNRCCLSAKMRTGFDSEDLFEDNLLAAAEHVDFIQIHGRTKVDGYHAPARWERIAQAKQMLAGTECRIVGNGDIATSQQAFAMVDQTGADGLMVGRAAVANPFIFYEIRERFGEDCGPRATPRDQALHFFQHYYRELQAFHAMHLGKPRFERTVSSKLKQMISQGFLSNPAVSPPGLVSEMSAALRMPQEEISSAALYAAIHNAIERHL